MIRKSKKLTATMGWLRLCNIKARGWLWIMLMLHVMNDHVKLRNNSSSTAQRGQIKINSYVPHGRLA